MLQGWIVVLCSFLYLGVLFCIAYYADKRADAGRSIIANPYIYALSMAVYCTSWTFYGSVGRAATSGISFLPIYLGPTLTFVLWWFLLRKIIHISKANRITSIADFIASRYGKSALLAGLVTIIAVVGIMPYISLQLKAVSTSFSILLQSPEISLPGGLNKVPLLRDHALYVSLLLAVFVIFFGTRHIDASEHHEGMVAAIAFESVVKLIAFLTVGIVVTFGIYNGFGDLFARAKADPEIAKVLTFGGGVGSGGSYQTWITFTILSMAAIICLPRQFQVTVVENVNPDHLNKAVWLFPGYLLLINIFVLPLAIAGLLHFPNGSVDGDAFLLAIPLAENMEALAMLVYIGGLSAATGMVIVATIALSTMVCNDLVMPVLLRIRRLGLHEERDLTRLLLVIRRGAILLILMLSYSYFRFIGESYALVTIGLVSFAAAAQFAPPIIGGILWKGGTRAGALVGLSGGFIVWIYTLMLPSLARSGWMPIAFIDSGPFGIELLKPYALFGLSGLTPLTHALFWSMLANIGGYIFVSLRTTQTPLERLQAVQFVDVFRQGERAGAGYWRGSARASDLYDLLVRFIGRTRATRVFTRHGSGIGKSLEQIVQEDAEPGLVALTERELSGAIGSSSARVMLGSVVRGETVGIEEVMEILDEASQVIEYSRQIEQKSHELEATSAELRTANEQLKELDRLKDEFISTVSHELRTPLTSIRSFGEILQDNPEISQKERRNFLSIIVKESERLTRLINQILDFAKMESGNMDWRMKDMRPRAAIRDALDASRLMIDERNIAVSLDLPGDLPLVHADPDRFLQVMLNLLSNAAKHCPETGGRIWVKAEVQNGDLRVSVADNGPGVPATDRDRIFERFQQSRNERVGNVTGNPQGTGLGLPICRQIVEYFGGRIWTRNRPEGGAVFIFTVPVARARRTGSGAAEAAE